MAIYNKINGVWRELWTSHVKIDGVWRESNVLTMVNGVWRENHTHLLEEKDIIGFRIVYKKSETKKHPDFPHLSYNHKIPVNVRLGGDSIGSMDLHLKSIIFEYFRENPEEEGILMYEGHLYAVLNNNIIVDIGNSQNNSNDERRNPEIPGISEIWYTDRLNPLSIQIQGYELYESNGYYMNGWNSLFEKDNFLDPTDYPDKEYHKNIHRLNSYNILPLDKRIDDFRAIANIGIARDMTSEVHNMIGSYGVLDQTIEIIWVNGVKKPFTMEIYD